MSRYSLLLCALIALAAAFVEEGSGETDYGSPTPAIQPVESFYDPIRRWNHIDVLQEYKKVEQGPPKKPCWQADDYTPVDGPCPKNWVHYKESCYLIEQNFTTLDKAELVCRGHETTLFVANTIEEWKHIQTLALPNLFTWVGMFKADESVTKDFWQTKDGIDPKELNWLIEGNDGWTGASRCAAMYASSALNYVHFQPCNFSFNYICERNATLYI